MTTIVENAPAKLNLVLSVSSDVVEGKHQLQTVFVTVDLADTLTFTYEAGETQGIEIEMTPDGGLAVDGGLTTPDIPPKDNIVYRAVCAFEEATGKQLPGNLRINIVKRIPAEAGLGGGSTDAAATLRALCQLTQTPVHSGAVYQTAARLGADVPFLLQGGCALMGGAGEKLICHLPTPALQLVLAKPALGVSTKAAYAAFDADPQPPASTTALLAALMTMRLEPAAVAQACANNLYPAALAQMPKLADLKQAMRSLPGVYDASLTGSGSAFFGICASKQAAEKAAACLSEQAYWAQVAQTT